MGPPTSPGCVRLGLAIVPSCYRTMAAHCSKLRWHNSQFKPGLRSGDSTGDSSVNDESLVKHCIWGTIQCAYRWWPYGEEWRVYPVPYALQNSHETILKISDPKDILLKQASGKAIPDSFKLKDIKLRYESGEPRVGTVHRADVFNWQIMLLLSPDACEELSSGSEYH